MADEVAGESSIQGKEDDELDELLDSKLFHCTFFVRLQSWDITLVLWALSSRGFSHVQLYNSPTILKANAISLILFCIRNYLYMISSGIKNK